jgi:glyoxylase-like metal-dependent hydrolase (beta-lactamase superfamily II)
VSTSAEASDGFEVIQVKYGERMTRKSVVLNDYFAYGEPDGDLHMEYNFWIFRRGNATILLDTGYDIPARDWLGEIPVKATPDGLALLEIDPADVSMVITSHFHYDHIGYLGLFANAEVVSGGAEYDYWFGKWRNNELEGEFTIESDLTVVQKAEREGRLRLVREPTEIAAGITVYPVGGHCPGELLTLVKSRSKPLIMAVDAAHFYEQIENEWPFFAFTSLEEMRAALSFMNKLAAEKGATIVPGHDGRVRQRYPALPGPAAGIATVLG